MPMLWRVKLFARPPAGLLPVVLLVVGVTLLAACTPPQEAARKRFFWPAGAAEPRIEYVTSFVSEQDLRGPEKDWFDEVVLGREHARRTFANPSAIASGADGRVLVSDLDLMRVLVFDLRQHRVRRLLEPSGSGVREFDAQVLGLTALADGGFCATTARPAEVALFGRDERLQRRFGSKHLQRPVGLAIDESRRRIYVADAAGHAVVLFSLDGEYLGSWGSRGGGDGQFNFPLDVAVDAQGLVYVLDSMNARVVVLTPEGTFLRAFGERGTAAGSFSIPKALAVSPQGDVYVSDSLGNKIVVFDREGRFLLSFGGHSVASAGISPGGMSLPVGIDIDANSAIWVVDSMNRMFHQFQYLTPEYLTAHPILSEERYLPREIYRQGVPTPAAR